MHRGVACVGSGAVGRWVVVEGCGSGWWQLCLGGNSFSFVGRVKGGLCVACVCVCVSVCWHVKPCMYLARAARALSL